MRYVIIRCLFDVRRALNELRLKNIVKEFCQQFRRNVEAIWHVAIALFNTHILPVLWGYSPCSSIASSRLLSSSLFFLSFGIVGFAGAAFV